MVTIASYTTSTMAMRLEELIELLQDAVRSGASVSFVRIPSKATAEAYWADVAHEVHDETRHLLVAETRGRVAGCVQLALAPQPNAAHRAEIQNLLVHRDFRRQGLGKQLIYAVEKTARRLERSLLVLDTQQGSSAEQLYENLGYIRAGVIPNFALSRAKKLEATVFFYKWLA